MCIRDSYYYLCYSLGLPFLSGVALAPFFRRRGSGSEVFHTSAVRDLCESFRGCPVAEDAAAESPALKTAPRTFVAGCISPAWVRTSLEGLGDYQYD